MHLLLNQMENCPSPKLLGRMKEIHGNLILASILHDNEGVARFGGRVTYVPTVAVDPS